MKFSLTSKFFLHSGFLTKTLNKANNLNKKQIVFKTEMFCKSIPINNFYFNNIKINYVNSINSISIPLHNKCETDLL